MNESCDNSLDVQTLTVDSFKGKMPELENAVLTELNSNNHNVFECMFQGDTNKAMDFYKKMKNLEYSDVAGNGLLVLFKQIFSSEFRDHSIQEASRFNKLKPLILGALSKYIIYKKYSVDIEGGFQNLYFGSHEFRNNVLRGYFFSDRKGAVNAIKFLEILLLGQNNNEGIALNDGKQILSIFADLSKQSSELELTDLQFAILDIFFSEDNRDFANYQENLARKRINTTIDSIEKNISNTEYNGEILSQQNFIVLKSVISQKIIPLMRKYVQKKYQEMYVSISGEKLR